MSEADESKCQGQQSRLDRLFSLLEAPSTSFAIRKVTAKQIASIVEASPQDGRLIIARLAPLVVSLSSDVRAAASFGLELISGAMALEDLDYRCPSPRLSLPDFDLEQVLADQLPLLASAGSEYELDPRLTAKMQKQNLKQVFSIAKGVELDDELTEEFVKEEDLATATSDDQNAKLMSARERAMAKRKAKQSPLAPAKRSVSSGSSASVMSFALSEGEASPLTKTASFFVEHLFCANWHVRHGCLLGIEAILEGQGRCGPRPSRETLCYHLLCLLALDRFGDFNGDHMVAPVREAAATVLGLVASNDDLAGQCAAALSAYPHHWQVRHGGLLGLNKLDVTGIVQSIPELTALAPQLLDDQDDDVKTLTARLLCRVLPAGSVRAHLGPIFEAVVALLERADDLSSSVSPVLELLRMLCEREEFRPDRRVPVLIRPFFRSPLSSVRLQTLQTVSSLGVVDEETSRQCLQVVLLEDNPEIANLAFHLLATKTCDFGFAAAYLPALFTPLGHPFPPGIFRFYCLGCPHATAQPPSHEFSFRPADAMVVDPAVACRQRLMAARALRGRFSDLSDYATCDLANVLIPALCPTLKCELVNEKRARDVLFKALYTHASHALHTASAYFCNTADELGPVVEFAAELVAHEISNPKDILQFLSGTFAPSNNLIKICRHMELEQGVTRDLLAQCHSPLLLLYVFLESGIDVSLDLCLQLVQRSAIDDLDDNAPTVFRSLFNRHPQPVIKRLLLSSFLPALKSDSSDDRRTIILLCIERLVLGDNEACSLIAAFAPFLLFPCLSRMSDQSERVRSIAAPLFAALVRLIPLDLQLPDGMEEHQEELERCRSFIVALSDPSKMLSCVPVPPSVKATLRPYQQTGYSWLVFLQRYGLHGALCDDMGLGKTLQTLACLSYYHHEQAAAAAAATAKKKSLVICPSGLVGHWKHEAQTYVPTFTTVVYEGKPADRRAKVKQPCDLLIVAYDVFRNDLEAFVAANDYGYLILDEGHLVRNTKTKLWSAVKSVKASHRLILTGTPIQNNVGELWALFDILMPGYLGDQRAFADSFARPIRAASLASASSSDFQTAQRCLKRLHKQVLPFILRRMKEDVLKDLPPKIIQDYECELSDEQSLLYNELVEQRGDAEVDTENRSMQKMAAFRKICIHPTMALDDPSVSPVLRQQVVEAAKRNGRPSLDDIALSPKLELLRDLIVSCGIVAEEDSECSSRHRMLIFAQQKRALDVVEGIVLKQLGSSLSWLRLDGNVPAGQRQSVVQRFNRDPSIGVLLLTTKVGGLGLNLTGADTVVFLEHDWNPMADLQAMDRAHRLGQQRVVSVYRLITKGTIEGRIMGLQQWKVRVAKTIVNQQNASMSSMETAGLLDLFVDDG